jgi:hypothetical protein
MDEDEKNAPWRRVMSGKPGCEIKIKLSATVKRNTKNKKKNMCTMRYP